MRSDIRSSIAGATGTAEGVLLTVKLKLVNTASSCADLSGYAIYIWHCDRDGLYSMYNAGVTDENYLRGVQPTDSSGVATTVYNTTGYAFSLSNFEKISFATDNVFSDGVTLQLSTVTGSVSEGFVATLTVGISG